MPGVEALTAWIDGGADGQAPRIEFAMTARALRALSAADPGRAGASVGPAGGVGL